MPAEAKSKKPTRKVRAASSAGLITAGAVSTVFALAHIGVSKRVAALIASLLTAAIAVGSAYLTKSGA